MMPSTVDPKKKLDESIAVYRTLIAQNPNVSNLHLYLGRALMEKGQDVEAIASLQRAVSLDSTCGEAYGRLGHLFVQLCRIEEGVAALQRAVELMPENARLPFYLFQAHSKAGNLDKAIASLQHSITLNPNDIETHTALLGTLLYSSDYSREQLFSDRAALGSRIEDPWRKKWIKPTKPVNLAKRLRIGSLSRVTHT
jgi:tetratricopeptide (TPR) repeat protein